MKNTLIMMALLAAAVAVGGSLYGRPVSALAEKNPPVKHLNPSQAADLLKKDPQVVILDIRTPDEYKAGHLEGATNIDFKAANFAEQVGRLDKSKTYLVHCASGRRSTLSLKTFETLGFQSVCHLDGGFNAWEKAELPVKK